MFQPGEEGHDGARHMISEGVLDAAGTPVAAYALHVASADWPAGVCSTRPGPMLAAAEVLAVTRSRPRRPRLRAPPRGRSDPGRLRDRDRAAEYGDPHDRRLRTDRADRGRIPRRHRAQRDPRRRGLPGDRALFSPEARDRVRESALALVGGIAAAHGLTVSAEFRDGYPVTVNDEAETRFAAGVAAGLLGEERCLAQPNPMTGAEDFSFVLEQVPGAFLMLGRARRARTRPPRPTTTQPTPCSTTRCWPTARRSTPSSRSSAWPVHDRGRVPRDGGSPIGNRIGLARSRPRSGVGSSSRWARRASRTWPMSSAGSSWLSQSGIGA